jgi:hypothetical protein
MILVLFRFGVFEVVLAGGEGTAEDIEEMMHSTRNLFSEECRR